MLLRAGSLCYLGLYLSITACGADSSVIAQYQPTADRLIDAALHDDEALARLAYLCDRIGNRLSGSDSLTHAVAWSAGQMKQAGLQNVATIPVKVPHWVRGSESASLLAPVRRPLHMLGLGMSVGTPTQGITADAMVVSTFDELDRLAEKVRGKIVVFDAPYEDYGKTVVYRASGPSRAAKLGAVAVLVRSITPLAVQLPHTGGLRYSDDSPRIPAAAITIEDATMLSRLQASGATPHVHIEMSAHMEPDADSADVVGEIPGNERPEQVVVMGGHIDSWDVGQGAQDDGSGIMATLGAAALIHRLGLKPKRTIRVAFWVNEENGARGGEAYRDWIGGKVKDHVAAIEMDEGAERPLGFGYGAFPPAVFLSTGGPSEVAPKSPEAEASRQLCRQIARLLVRVQATEVASFGGGSDIEPIVKLGVPSLSPTTTAEHYFDWHHTQADTFDKVDPGDFRKNVAVLAVLSYVLADMPGRLAGSTAP
jgi:hypothetical protein